MASNDNVAVITWYFSAAQWHLGDVIAGNITYLDGCMLAMWHTVTRPTSRKRSPWPTAKYIIMSACLTVFTIILVNCINREVPTHSDDTEQKCFFGPPSTTSRSHRLLRCRKRGSQMQIMSSPIYYSACWMWRICYSQCVKSAISRNGWIVQSFHDGMVWYGRV